MPLHRGRHPDSPGYHPVKGRYEFKIDLNDDAIEDLTYRITFDERDPAGTQRFVLRRITGADAAEQNAAGTVVAQGATGEAVTTPAGVRIWAGKAGDPFWIEPDVARAVGHAFQDGTIVDLSTWNPARAKNVFAGHTVYSIVLEVPDKELLPDAGHNHRIRVWALASLATDAGGWSQINRAGLPMIHPLFTRHNEDLGNRLNGIYAGYPQVLRDLQMIAGTPDSVIPKLRKILDVLRPGIFSFWLDGPVSAKERKRCLELLNRDVIPALREYGMTLGLVSPFERAPGSRPLGPDGVYAAVSNPEALADE